MIIDIEKAAVVTEAKRAAAEAAIVERLGADAPKPVCGCAGNSPYSAQTIVFRAVGADERGSRVALAAVCRSHDGFGHYGGRGRWRTVCVAAPKPDGDLAVCDASDRDAEEVGYSNFFVRPWATHEAEQASRGLGLAQDAMAAEGPDKPAIGHRGDTYVDAQGETRHRSTKGAEQ